jgi:hypothetical protein
MSTRYNRPKRTLGLEPLELRHLLAGVTILTHGFQATGAFPDWLVTMGQAILDRADGERTDRSVGSIFKHDPAASRWEPLGAGVWNNSNSADDHVVLLYDWASDSGEFSDGWLEAAADNLFASLVQENGNLGGDLAGRFVDVACGRPLDLLDQSRRSSSPSAGEGSDVCRQFEFHFIGHSRGAMLNSLVTERLGHYFPTVSVAHVTSLDPHPASAMNDPGYVPDDPNANSRVFTYSNVLFADNYFRQDGLYEFDGDFNGVLADGAYNLQIPEEVLENGGSSFEHSDVHTWYYGTVTEPFDAGYSGYGGAGRNHDGDVSFPETWYGVSGVPPRSATGFYFSLLGAGDRSQLPITGMSIEPTEPASIVNGDFTFGDGTFGDEVPGWERHGGAFDGSIESGRLHLGESLFSEFLSATHNPPYVPPRSQALVFDYEVTDTSGDDVLEVYLGDDATPLDTLSLAGRGAFSANLPVDAALAGTVTTLRLRLNPGGATDSDVFIDNLQFLQNAPAPGDFDEDGDYDCQDVDLLVAAIAAGSSDLLFDLTGDADVTTADLDLWLALAGAANLPSGNAYLPGDANLDGSVDGLDFLEWNHHKFTSLAAWCAGDFNADGQVDGPDFVIWNSHKFQTAGTSEEPRIGEPQIAPLPARAPRIENHGPDGLIALGAEFGSPAGRTGGRDWQLIGFRILTMGKSAATIGGQASRSHLQGPLPAGRQLIP